MLEQPAFGQRLRALRVEHGLTQAALAGDSLSTGYLSRLESGTRPPTGRVVELLAARLGVPKSEFDTPATPERRLTSLPSQSSSLSQILAAVISSTGRGELDQTLTEALRGEDPWDPALRWQALWLLARSRGEDGKHTEECELLTELVQLSEELESPVLLARSHTALSRCVSMLGDYIEARQHALRARTVAAGLSRTDQIDVLRALLTAEAEMGLLGEARAHADELVALAEPAAGPRLVEALWAAATVRIRHGDYPDAQRVLDRALQLLDSRDDLVLWIRLRLAAASLYLQVTPPRTDLARARLDEVAALVGLVGTDLHHQQLTTLQAYLAFAEGRLDDARELTERLRGEPLLLSFRDRIRFGALQGQLQILGGDREQGIRLLQELARQAQDARNVELAADIWRALAETLAEGSPRVQPAGSS